MTGPEVRTVRGGDAVAWWEFATRAAGTPLAGYVRTLVGYREHSPTALPRRVFPTGELTLIISFGPSIRLDGIYSEPAATLTRQQVTSFAAGLDTAPGIVTYTGEQHGIEVKLHPLRAGAVFGRPTGELSGQVVDLADLWGREADQLVERLAELPDWATRFDTVERFLEHRIAAGPAVSPAIAWAMRQLQRTDGRVAIAELVDDLGCSRRYLATRFREQVGLSPKLYARVLRFRHAVGLRRAMPYGRLSDLAVACGYYDEAHLHRDFREFAGLTPDELVAETAQAPA